MFGAASRSSAVSFAASRNAVSPFDANIESESIANHRTALGDFHGDSVLQQTTVYFRTRSASVTEESKSEQNIVKTTFPVRSAACFVGLQLLFGTAQLCLGSWSVMVDAGWSEYGAPLWSGSAMVLCGMSGVFCSITRRYNHIALFTSCCVASAVLSLACIILSAYGIAHDNRAQYAPDEWLVRDQASHLPQHLSREDVQHVFTTRLKASSAVLCCAVVGYVISVLASVTGCRGICLEEPSLHFAKSNTKKRNAKARRSSFWISPSKPYANLEDTATHSS